ncbi:MAG TPA: hypothetical protein VF161_09815 [Steroidobacteraceae bacterium]|jgi:hypothetical protein
MKATAFAAVLLVAAVQAQAAEPVPLPKSTIEVLRIAPGQHENFLMFAWHEDTEAIRPTTAIDYLATRKNAARDSGAPAE